MYKLNFWPFKKGKSNLTEKLKEEIKVMENKRDAFKVKVEPYGTDNQFHDGTDNDYYSIKYKMPGTLIFKELTKCIFMLVESLSSRHQPVLIKDFDTAVNYAKKLTEEKVLEMIAEEDAKWENHQVEVRKKLALRNRTFET